MVNIFCLYDSPLYINYSQYHNPTSGEIGCGNGCDRGLKVVTSIVARLALVGNYAVSYSYNILVSCNARFYFDDQILYPVCNDTRLISMQSLF